MTDPAPLTPREFELMVFELTNAASTWFNARLQLMLSQVIAEARAVRKDKEKKP